MSQKTTSVDPPDPVPHLIPEYAQQLKEYFETLLGKVIQTTFSSQFATESSMLATFRNSLPGIRKDGMTTENTSIAHLDSFRTAVPLSNYDDYEPFIRTLLSQPCKRSQVENLLAPGLPIFVSQASMTTGKKIKYFPRYSYPCLNSQKGPAFATIKIACLIMQIDTNGDFAVLDDQNDVGYGKEEERVVAKIPLCQISATVVRLTAKLGYEHDDIVMKSKSPRLTSPFGVCFIRNYRTSLLMHALFALKERELESIYTTYGTVYADLLTFIQQEWDNLLLSIETGILPHFDGLEHVKPYLQQYFSSDKERAMELRSLASLKDSPGWFKMLWPNLKECIGVLSGIYSAVLPKVRSTVGPDVHLRSTGYVLSECWVGITYKGLNSYVLTSDAYFEFLPVSLELDTLEEDEETAESLIPVWELKSGKMYEPVITSIDGFWRYRLRDVVKIEGFSPANGFPIMNYVQRRQDEIRLFTDMHFSLKFSGMLLANAILSTTEDSIGRVSQFTSYLDIRPVPSVIGYIVELDGDMGPNPSLARYQVLEVLRAQHGGMPSFLQDTYPTFLPTIRVVKHGTFAEYRHWRVESAGINTSQVKVPAVLANEALLERFFASVVYEA